MRWLAATPQKACVLWVLCVGSSLSRAVWVGCSAFVVDDFIF
jgi:hypothetical protein